MPPGRRGVRAQRCVFRRKRPRLDILTHCAPTSIALQLSRNNVADHLTDFLQEVKDRAQYHYWLFGHYHNNKAIDTKYILLWEQIVQIL